jgi:hypothetical protein
MAVSRNKGKQDLFFLVMQSDAAHFILYYEKRLVLKNQFPIIVELGREISIYFLYTVEEVSDYYGIRAKNINIFPLHG